MYRLESSTFELPYKQVRDSFSSRLSRRWQERPHLASCSARTFSGCARKLKAWPGHFSGWEVREVSRLARRRSALWKSGRVSPQTYRYAPWAWYRAAESGSRDHCRDHKRGVEVKIEEEKRILVAGSQEETRKLVTVKRDSEPKCRLIGRVTAQEGS
jgi:hypothetical protein